MIDSKTPAIGAIGLTQIKGKIGVLVRIGQWLAGGGFANYEHAFICVEVRPDAVYAIEAEPGGASLEDYFTTDGVFWLHIPVTDEQRKQIVLAARKYVGTPYSFLDYLALAAHKFRFPIPGLKRYVASTGHMICSQFVDQCYQDAGVHLFEDHRWPGYVMPADLYNLHPTLVEPPVVEDVK